VLEKDCFPRYSQKVYLDDVKTSNSRHGSANQNNHFGHSSQKCGHDQTDTRPICWHLSPFFGRFFGWFFGHVHGLWNANDRDLKVLQSCINGLTLKYRQFT
jgi:hypothetical protein